MNNFNALIEFYGNANSEEMFTLKEKGNKKDAVKYLEKYYLQEKEYLLVWKPIEDKIFINKKMGLPQIVFSTEYYFTAIRGGTIFEKKDFLLLQKCMLELGDKYLIIIQNSFGRQDNNIPIFKMKYPSSISWEEIMTGNFLSTALFEMPKNDYFIFSESGCWGKYVDNEVTSLDIIGFLPQYKNLFIKTFKGTDKEQKEIYSWLPENYKENINLIM